MRARKLEWDILDPDTQDDLRENIPGNANEIGVYDAEGDGFAVMVWSAGDVRNSFERAHNYDESAVCPIKGDEDRYLVVWFTPEWADWGIDEKMTMAEADTLIEKHRLDNLSQEEWEAEMLKKSRAEGKRPRQRRPVMSAKLCQEVVAAVLEEHGFSPAGTTETRSIRIPTQKAPVFGHGPNPPGGELRTVGGRDRFVRGSLRATVGPITTNFYTLSPATGRQLRTGKTVAEILRSFKTRELEQIRVYLDAMPAAAPATRALVAVGPVVDRMGPKPPPRLSRA